MRETTITSPLEVDSLTDTAVRYVGEPISDYAVRVTGTKFSVLSNVRVECGHRCRGVLASRQAYGTRVAGLEIDKPIEVGLDALHCWGSLWQSVFINDAFGFALRIYRCQSSVWQNVRAKAWAMHDERERGIDTWQYRSSAITKFAMVNGVEAARQKFDHYSEAWPATDDTAAILPGGKYYRTVDADHCAVMLDSCNCVSVYGLMCEGCYTVDAPNVLLDRPNTVTCVATRFEANRANELIHLQGRSAPPDEKNMWCEGNQLIGLHANQAKFDENGNVHPYSRSRTVVRESGHTRNNHYVGFSLLGVDAEVEPVETALAQQAIAE